jgi:hypothetical protein
VTAAAAVVVIGITSAAAPAAPAACVFDGRKSNLVLLDRRHRIAIVYAYPPSPPSSQSGAVADMWWLSCLCSGRPLASTG